MRFLPAIVFLTAAAQAEQARPFHRSGVLVRPLVQWSDIDVKVKVRVRIAPVVIPAAMSIPLCTTFPNTPSIEIDPVTRQWHIRLKDR